MWTSGSRCLSLDSLPSHSCQTTRGASLALAALGGVAVTHCLRQSQILRNLDVYFTRHPHRAIYKKCNFTERGEKKEHICNWWQGRKTLLSCSFIASVRRWIQDKGHWGGISWRLVFLTYKTSPNNLVMKTSSVNRQLYLSVLPPFWIRVIYILFVEGVTFSRQNPACCMDLQRDVSFKVN